MTSAYNFVGWWYMTITSIICNQKTHSVVAHMPLPACKILARFCDVLVCSPQISNYQVMHAVVKIVRVLQALH